LQTYDKQWPHSPRGRRRRAPFVQFFQIWRILRGNFCLTFSGLRHLIGSCPSIVRKEQSDRVNLHSTDRRHR
jgi:hypothetical protein